MSTQLKRMPGEPTVIITYRRPLGSLTRESGPVCRQVAALTRGIAGTYNRILDFSHAHISYSDIVGLIYEEMVGAPGSITDPKARVVLVGDAKIAEMAEAVLHSVVGNLEVESFTNLEDALYFTSALPVNLYKHRAHVPSGLA